jgi:hypothetical protein
MILHGHTIELSRLQHFVILIAVVINIIFR